jgi:hypothetical protein
MALDGIWRDLRHAVRQLRRSPAFTLTAVVTLALGIGATTAIFTLVEQVMLRSLPVVRPPQLWRIGDAIKLLLPRRSRTWRRSRSAGGTQSWACGAPAAL